MLRHTQQKLTKHQLLLPHICRRNYTFQRSQVRKWTPSNSTLALHESNNQNQGGMCLCQGPAQMFLRLFFRVDPLMGGKFEMFECVTFFLFVLHTFVFKRFPQCFCFKREDFRFQSLPVCGPIFFLMVFFWCFRLKICGCCRGNLWLFSGRL